MNKNSDSSKKKRSNNTSTKKSPNKKKSTSLGGSLNIITFNCLSSSTTHFNKGSSKYNESPAEKKKRYDRIIYILSKINSDIVALQEVDSQLYKEISTHFSDYSLDFKQAPAPTWWKGKPWDTHGLLTMYNKRRFRALPVPEVINVTHSKLISINPASPGLPLNGLSKYAIAQKIELFDRQEKQNITVINTHLTGIPDLTMTLCSNCFKIHPIEIPLPPHFDTIELKHNAQLMERILPRFNPYNVDVEHNKCVCRGFYGYQPYPVNVVIEGVLIRLIELDKIMNLIDLKKNNIILGDFNEKSFQKRNIDIILHEALKYKDSSLKYNIYKFPINQHLEHFASSYHPYVINKDKTISVDTENKYSSIDYFILNENMLKLNKSQSLVLPSPHGMLGVEAPWKICEENKLQVDKKMPEYKLFFDEDNSTSNNYIWPSDHALFKINLNYHHR